MKTLTESQHYWRQNSKLTKFSIGVPGRPFLSEKNALALLPKTPLRVLDLGCGAGVFLGFGSEFLDLEFYCGLDNSKELLEEASRNLSHQRGLGIKLHQDDCKNFTKYLARYRCNLLWSIGVMQHLHEQCQLIANIMKSGVSNFVFDLKVSGNIRTDDIGFVHSDCGKYTVPYVVNAEKNVLDTLMTNPNYNVETIRYPTKVFEGVKGLDSPDTVEVLVVIGSIKEQKNKG